MLNYDVLRTLALFFVVVTAAIVVYVAAINKALKYQWFVMNNQFDINELNKKYLELETLLDITNELNSFYCSFLS